jgi:3D-(3,5/4)-trihydroxycyclohexane-1,2-dione acylhydrolase (decyclizing)
VSDAFEVLTMGRIGVDVYPLQVGVSLREVETFGKYLGGSATNVAVAAARYGRRTAVISNAETGRLDGGVLPVDLAANAESLGVQVLRATNIDEFRSAVQDAKKSDADGPVMVHVETDPLIPAPSSESWWDGPVAEVADLDATRDARKNYEETKSKQRLFL